MPDAKLIVILRNPVKRAFSHFNTLKETKARQRNFKEIFTEKKVLRNGFYAPYLEMYLKEFSREQFKFLLFDSFTKNKSKFFYSFFDFVGVEPNFLPDTSLIMRKGGEIKQKTLSNFFQERNLIQSAVGFMVKPFTTADQRRYIYIKVQNMFTKKREIPLDIQTQLTELYREDILQVQDMLNIDLSHWLKASSK